MFVALAANDTALNAQRLAAGDGPKKVSFDLASHGRFGLGAHGLAHGLIEERDNDAAVQIAGMSLECVGDDGMGDDEAFRRKEEVEVQTGVVGRSTAEAAIAGSVGEGRELLVAFCHAGLAACRVLLSAEM